ncbi:transcriptional regulator [Leptospira broomii serovar Hurstbridge str. 5399]|uniref:Transcriptional regulator n=1 Tax=Leptospira broomii serovar Hurstbridge str. 5399 TaxID=1049789 RepID=T0G9A0_9LEPT|nr:Rrf2 family transcriptional regulator [Leptospira broomii]EQA43404.1 transcriptional regulator [Leptospira broomii serovar Hurstbridge str. 5399]
MSIPSRYSIAIHVLSLIELENSAEITSQLMASSIGTNPVVVRGILGKLKKAGLVVTRQGVPGASLAKTPAEIRLLEVYKAVESTEELFSMHAHANPKCPVGKRIQGALVGIFQEAQKALEDKLNDFSLADVLLNIEQESKKRA